MSAQDVVRQSMGVQEVGELASRNEMLARENLKLKQQVLNWQDKYARLQMEYAHQIAHAQRALQPLNEIILGHRLELVEQPAPVATAATLLPTSVPGVLQLATVSGGIGVPEGYGHATSRLQGRKSPGAGPRQAPQDHDTVLLEDFARSATARAAAGELDAGDAIGGHSAMARYERQGLAGLNPGLNGRSNVESMMAYYGEAEARSAYDRDGPPEMMIVAYPDGRHEVVAAPPSKRARLLQELESHETVVYDEQGNLVAVGHLPANMQAAATLVGDVELQQYVAAQHAKDGGPATSQGARSRNGKEEQRRSSSPANWDVGSARAVCRKDTSQEGDDKFFLQAKVNTVAEIWKEFYHEGPGGKPPVLALMAKYGVEKWFYKSTSQEGLNNRKNIWNRRNKAIVYELLFMVHHEHMSEEQAVATLQAQMDGGSLKTSSVAGLAYCLRERGVVSQMDKKCAVDNIIYNLISAIAKAPPHDAAEVVQLQGPSHSMPLDAAQATILAAYHGAEDRPESPEGSPPLQQV